LPIKIQYLVQSLTDIQYVLQSGNWNTEELEINENIVQDEASNVLYYCGYYSKFLNKFKWRWMVGMAQLQMDIGHGAGTRDTPPRQGGREIYY
jgi:hypothetical protein